MKQFLGWLLPGALVLSAAGCQTPTRTDPPAPTPAVRTTAATSAGAEPAPDFTLSTIDGDPITLSDLRGRWVLVNFWATWCAPCRDEMPLLASLAATQRDTLTVLAVNMREDPAKVRAYLAELNMTLPILVDPDDATLLAYGVRGLPVSFLIAPDGALARRIVGPIQTGDIPALIQGR